MKDFFKNIKFAWNYAKNEKKYIFISIIMSITDIILEIILPILSARTIIALTSNNYIRIITISLVILLINCTSIIVYYIFRKCTMIVYKSTLSNLEKELGKNILMIENKCLDKNGSGVFIQRLTNDTSKLADIFDSQLEMTSDLIRYAGMLVAILVVNRIIFIYVLITLIIINILEKIRTDKRKEDDKKYRIVNEKLSSFIGELVRGARDIRMLNSEKDFLSELDKRIDTSNKARLKMQRTSLNYRTIIWIISNLNNFLLIILLVILMEKNIIISTIALVLYNYARNTSDSVYLIGYLLESIKDFNLSSERIQAILADKEFTKEKFGTKHLDKIEGDFEFKNVDFKYTDKPILKNLNFKIKANETVAFVGKSGSGKTTIFNLLCKMYDIEKGEITIDGINIKELDKDSIRGNITIISQNPYIFNMTIKENLKLVKNDLTDKEMKEACKIACLEEFINELPDKYDTIIGEGGVNLSGGQKQRLAIARALIQKTEIILFDEATSALDNETQTKIQEAIDNMKNEYTILIIAHRLSTIINSDRILYLEDGQIAAEGKHKELLKTCEGYKKLYNSKLNKE